MIKFSKLYYILIILGISSSAFSQPLKTIPYTANLEKADEYANSNHLLSQLIQLEDAYKKKKDRALLPLMAELNYKLRDYNKAENYFKRIVDLDKKKTNVEAAFYYGNSLKLNGKYNESKTVFEEVIASGTNPWAQYAQLQIEGINQSGEFEQNSKLFIENIGPQVNSKSGDFSPYLYNGSLYYTTANPDLKDEPTKEYQVKLYKSSLTKSGSWSKGELASTNINSASNIIGNFAIDENDEIAYITKSKTEGEAVSSSQIYYCTKDGADWSEPIKLKGLFDSSIILHPMPGELFGHKVLFFSSNAPGGLGGYDLYYANNKGNGEFDSPVNLGASINTPEDESTPFYKNGKLYFSSNGRIGFGGFDVYDAIWNGSTWSQPKNMGLGYNSSADDRYFTIDKEGYEGFLVSNRTGTISFQGKSCCDDIFHFQIKKPVIDIMITVLDGKTPLKGSALQIMEKYKLETSIEDQDDTSNVFEYELDLNKSYQLNARKIGYFPDSTTVYTQNVQNDTSIQVIFNLKPKPEVEVITTNQPIRLNNIYYDYNSSKILEDSKPDLVFLYDLMIQYPTMIIELSSHTDSRGKNAYNEKLSQSRAESAKAYIVSRGIDTARITPKGYGESIILNKCIEGVTCTDEEHRFNRRTEFKIISGPTSIEIKKRITKERGKVIKSETLTPPK